MADRDDQGRRAAAPGAEAGPLMAGAAAIAVLATACGAAEPAAQRRGDPAAPAIARQARASYRDGTYTASGLYGGLPSKLTVTATIAGDRLARVSVETHATDPTSLDYQRRFAAAVPGVVVGKRVDEVKIGKLAGASGCPDGFNAALAKIRDEARATGRAPST